MKRKPRNSSEVRAVPSGYEPGYPAKLDAAEYRQLIERPVTARVRGVAAALGLTVFGGAAAGQDSKPAPTREDRVLGVLRAACSDTRHYGPGWFERSSFRPKAGLGGPYRSFVPLIPISFGNSYSGTFDKGEVCRLARELFDVYGIKLDVDGALNAAGGRAVLDGVNGTAKVGFKIRGGKRVQKATGWPGQLEPASEPDETALSDAELAALNKDGWRIHVSESAELAKYDGEGTPATFAFLASVIDFLNAVTDGPHFDISQMALGWEQKFPIAPGQTCTLPKDAVVAKAERGARTIRLASQATLTIACGGAAGTSVALRPRGGSGAWRVLDKPMTSAGSPSILTVPLSPASPHDGGAGEAIPRLVFRLIQEKSGDHPAVRLEAAAARIFAPAAFDAARPFTIEIDASAGTYILDDGLLVTIMPR